jgi:biopolymer transport protein ExbD
MAGGGGGLQVPERSKRGKFSKRKKKKRIGFHLDMTPLVDITFLLLTFFMFTTTMLTPQVMEMSIPPEIFKNVEVLESELLQIRIRDDGKIFWNIGNDDPQPIKVNEIKKMAEIENLKPKVKNRLITVLKASEQIPFGLVVSVLDQLNLAEEKITESVIKDFDKDGKPVKRSRKFTLAPLSEEDVTKIAEAK